MNYHVFFLQALYISVIKNKRSGLSLRPEGFQYQSYGGVPSKQKRSLENGLFSQVAHQVERACAKHRNSGSLSFRLPKLCILTGQRAGFWGTQISQLFGLIFLASRLFRALTPLSPRYPSPVLYLFCSTLV